MDRRERLQHGHFASLRAQLTGWQAGIWTALPAIVESFDATAVTVVAQPTIQAQVRDQSGSWNNVTLPLCGDCPVVFPGGGGYGLTFPLEQGDEGLLVFASRCIDAWWAYGEVQPQQVFRMHDLSDGFFLPGVFSQPRKPVAIPSTGVQLRSNDGEAYFEIAGQIANMVFPGDVNLRGNLVVTGTITSSGDVTAAGISVATHTHGGVTTGGGETGEPTS
jgi:hypothetical protein